MVRAIKLPTIQSAERSAFGPLLLRPHGRPPKPTTHRRYETGQPSIPVEPHRTSSTSRPTSALPDANLETAVPARPQGTAIEWTLARRSRLLGDFVYNGLKRANVDVLADKYGISKAKLLDELFPHDDKSGFNVPPAVFGKYVQDANAVMKEMVNNSCQGASVGKASEGAKKE